MADDEKFKRALPYDYAAEMRKLTGRVTELEDVVRTMGKALTDLLAQLSREHLEKIERDNERAQQMMNVPTAYVRNDDDLQGLL